MAASLAATQANGAVFVSNSVACILAPFCCLCVYYSQLGINGQPKENPAQGRVLLQKGTTFTVVLWV
jgi:hypothetical protein